jgi:enoyl-CoA hydratase
VLKSTAMLATSAAVRAQEPVSLQPATTLADVPLGPAVTLIVERRGDIVLVGLNRPFIQNRTRRRGSDWW